MPRYLVVLEVDELKFVTTRTADDAGEALADAMDTISDETLDREVQNIKFEVTPIEERHAESE